ncbi:MAG: hypothetical protein J6W69_01095 [Bacteroidales bacterium]|nr:hypothetical protein [Bacteroidales bacterium]
MKKSILVLFIIATIVFVLQIWSYVSSMEILPIVLSCGWWISMLVLLWMAYKQKPNN